MQSRGSLRRLLALLTAIAFLSGCVMATIRPFENGQNLRPESEGENRLWHAAQKIEKTLEQSGQIHEDPELRNYLQGVMDRLYPDFEGKVRVGILKAPVLNAFALPNGAVYVNMGLIAAVENEAQLATVLAHEGVHFVNKHSALQRKNYHNTVGVSWAVALLGIPFLSELISATSMFGYSQQLENEADRLGHERLVQAGYDIREAPKIFQHLAVEAKANKVKEPFFFSSHPKLEDRIKSFEILNQTIISHQGGVYAEAYQRHVTGLRPEVLKAKVTAGKYDAVIAVLTQETLKPLYGDRGYFYLAEAYRLRNQAGDLEYAIDAYEIAASRCPDFAPVFKSLGIACLRAKLFQKAVESFGRYLELNPGGTDCAFVRQYLDKAKNGAVEP